MDGEFVKAIDVAFAKQVAKFDDMLVLSKAVNKMNMDPVMAERSNDVQWIPQPYVVRAASGRDATGGFNGKVQMAVPARQGYERNVSDRMSSPQIRDLLQQDRLFEAHMQALASEINIAVMDTVSLTSTLTVKRTSAATGYDEIGAAESLSHSQGVTNPNRFFCYGPYSFQGAASNLQGRQTVNGIVQTAYERARVAQIAAYDILKMDYAYTLTAATGTSVSINGANQFYVPQATAVTATGELYPVDNRFQTVALTVGGGAVKAGDRFTIVGVNAVHQITKRSTNALKTFTVIQAPAGGGSGNYVISPPIISGQGGTEGEIQYQNVTATPADGASLVFLNTVTGELNPFFVRDSISLLPGKVGVTSDNSVKVMRATTPSGIEVVSTMFTDINNLDLKFRSDVKFGVVNLNPEMNGAVLFSQS